MISLSATELAEKFKRIKEGRSADIFPCKFGVNCKYRYTTCRRDHPPDPEVEREKAEMETKENFHLSGTLAAMPKAVSSKHMEDAVSKGLRISQGTGRKKRSRRNDEESKEGGDDEEENQDQDEEAMQDEDSGSDSSNDADALEGEEEESDLPASKRFKYDYLPSAVPDLPAAAAAGDSSSNSPAAAAAAGSSSADFILSAPKPNLFAKPLPSGPSFPTITKRAPDALNAREAAVGVAAALAKVKAKEPQQEKKKAEESAQSAAASTAASFDPIDLTQIASVADLVALGTAHLAFELNRVGLKSGGTVEQRAERLFMLKGTAIDKIPKKLRANLGAAS
jgi:hypothetical protein